MASYRAMTGIDYTKGGKVVHLSPGDELTDKQVADASLDSEVAAGNLCKLNDKGEVLDQNGFPIPADLLADPTLYNNKKNAVTNILVLGQEEDGSVPVEPVVPQPIPTITVVKKSAGGVIFRDGKQIDWANDGDAVALTPERAEELLSAYPDEFSDAAATAATPAADTTASTAASGKEDAPKTQE